MAFIASIHFLYTIGAGFEVGQQDLAKLVSLVGAKQHGVFIDIERNVRQCFHTAAVILDDAQAGIRLVFQGVGGDRCLDYIHRMDLTVQLIPDRRCDLADLICAGQKVRELADTGHIGSACLGRSGFNVPDLHLSPIKAIAVCRINLFDTQITIRFVCEGDFCRFTITNSDRLGRRFSGQVVFRRDEFRYHIGAALP